MLTLTIYIQNAVDSAAMWLPFERRRPDPNTKRDVEKMVLKVLAKLPADDDIK